MGHFNRGRPREGDEAATRENGIGAKVGKRVGSAALRGAASTARLAGRAALYGGKATVASGRRAGKRRKA
jgi:hypothetical protein